MQKNTGVWKEAFEPQTDLTYPDASGQGYDTGSFLDNITYTVDQQKKNSWRFWFRQVNANGREPQYSHGAAFYSGDKPPGLLATAYDTSLPIMWKWYNDVFVRKNGVKLGNG